MDDERHKTSTTPSPVVSSKEVVLKRYRILESSRSGLSRSQWLSRTVSRTTITSRETIHIRQTQVGYPLFLVSCKISMRVNYGSEEKRFGQTCRIPIAWCDWYFQSCPLPTQWQGVTHLCFLACAEDRALKAEGQCIRLNDVDRSQLCRNFRFEIIDTGLTPSLRNKLFTWRSKADKAYDYQHPRYGSPHSTNPTF